MVIKTILSVLSLFVMLSCSMTGKKDIKQQPGMCAKLPMAADGIVRLSKIEVYPEYLEEYMKYATEVGEVSLRTEPGVLTMYAVSEKENSPVRYITVIYPVANETPEISARFTDDETFIEDAQRDHHRFRWLTPA